MNFKQRLKVRALHFWHRHVSNAFSRAFFPTKTISPDDSGIVIGTLEHVFGIHYQVFPSTYTLSNRIWLHDGPEGFVKPTAILRNGDVTLEVPCELCYQATPTSVEIRSRAGLYITPPMEVYIAVTASGTPGDYIEWSFRHGNKNYSGKVETIDM